MLNIVFVCTLSNQCYSIWDSCRMLNLSILYLLKLVAPSDIVDTCDYSEGYALCGDVCIHAYYSRWCGCGEEIIKHLWSEQKYCCVDTSQINASAHCTTYESKGDAKCPFGKVLYKNETCNGLCFNDYYTSTKLGPGSHYNCGDKDQCVPVKEMCRGYPL